MHCASSLDLEEAHQVGYEALKYANMGHSGYMVAIKRDSNAPYSNLVLGEVIGFPGKWSSYPPHNHPQPEIYYYKFNPENGYGFAELDETVYKTHNNSTVFIVNEETHPQTTAPGYAMWYLWVIRHLDGNPYITPYFIPEHRWVTDPENEKLMWPPMKGE